MSYCPPSEFLKRFDNRIIGDLCSDTGTRVNPAALLTDPNLQASLDDAAGQIDAAIFVAQRYTPANLASLTGQDQAFLYWLNATLAFARLRMRRGVKAEEFIPEYKDAQTVLQKLREGDRVFAIGANERDGNPTSGFPTATVYAYTNLMRDYARRYFPLRRDQQPKNNEVNI